MNDGSDTAPDHNIPGIGNNPEALAQYLESQRGQAARYDVDRPNARVHYDDDKGVIVVDTGTMIHAYRMSRREFYHYGNYASLSQD